MIRVRDLPVAGRVTFLRWRKRRFVCEGCERTFTETHPALPSRQRVSARFRAHLFERCRGGGAHAEVARDERTSRYQVARAFAIAGDELVARREDRPPRRLSFDEAHHPAVASWPRSSLTLTADASSRCCPAVSARSSSGG